MQPEPPASGPSGFFTWTGTTLVGKQKLRVAQLGEGNLRRWQEQWGGGAQFLPEMPETSSQPIHWTGAAGGEWPGCWSWAKPCIFTNKSDMKPVPLGVVLGKGESHYDRTGLHIHWDGPVADGQAHAQKKPVSSAAHLVA